MFKHQNPHIDTLIQEFLNKIAVDFSHTYPSIKENGFDGISISAIFLAIEAKRKKENAKFLLSEVTFRRIIEPAKDYKKPHLNTLNYLAWYCGYKSFADFIENYPKVSSKLTDVESSSLTSSETKEETSTPTTLKEVQPVPSTKRFNYFWIIGIIGVAALYLIFNTKTNKNTTENLKGKLRITSFEAQKAPITVNFSYELPKNLTISPILDFNLPAMSGDTIVLSKDSSTLKYCFIHPTRRTARLKIGKQTLDSIKIIIPSDGWVAGYDGIYYLPRNKWAFDGFAHIDESYFKDKNTLNFFVKKVGFEKPIDSDNLTFIIKLKNDIQQDGGLCRDVSINLLGESNDFTTLFTQTGCTFYNYIDIDFKRISGKQNDLSALGFNWDEFQEIKITFKDQTFQIFNKNELKYTGKYRKPIGKLEAAYINFRGLGTIDYLKVIDNRTNKVIEEENF